jgi:cell shape-determining protein MreD
MRYIFYIILIGAIVGITFGLFRSWGWHGFMPNVILLSIISLSLAFRNYDYMIFAGLGGFWFDILYGLPIGSFTLPFIFVGIISSFVFQRWLFTEVRWQHFLLAVVIATVFIHSWLWLYSNILFVVKWSPIAISGSQLLRTTVLTVVANVLLAYPVYVIVELIAQSRLRLKKNQIRL